MRLSDAQNVQWPTYIASGNMEDDCVPAAIAYVIGAKRSLPPNAAVQFAFQKWQGGKAARWVGLTTARFYKYGLDGYKPGCFGPIEADEVAIATAITMYGGVCVGLMGAHMVAAVAYDESNVYFVSAGTLVRQDWSSFLKMVDASTFAFADKYDPALAGGFWWYVAKWFGWLL